MADLFVDVHFAAVLTRAEQQLIRDLPDWPTQQKLTDGERTIAARLARLRCIRIDRGDFDPVAEDRAISAGVTPLGRESAQRGIVRLSQ